MPFGLELDRHGTSTVVRLAGELDVETSPELRGNVSTDSWSSGT